MMSTAELLLWSSTVGAMGLAVLLAGADAAITRSRAAVQALVYLVCCWWFFALLSGVAEALALTLWPAVNLPFETARILIGPLCAALGCHGVSSWLSAAKRDRLMEVSLRACTALCGVGGPLCLLLPQPWQLPLAGGLAVAGISLAVWMSARAALLGDRMAWGMALACLLSLLAELGLYGLALQSGRTGGLPGQFAIAVAGLSSVVLTGLMLWVRNRRARQQSEGPMSRRDPITQLYSGMAIVQKILQAGQRRRRTRRDGALLAVLVFEPERLLSQVGAFGLNDIYIQLARRIQRQTGVVNPAGRYYDRCFVVLIETMHSPRWMRTLGLRVASSLRRPLEVTSLGGDRIALKADIGVGIVHLSAGNRDVDDLLHEAQQVAQAARGMRSRAAVLDPETGQAVAVESADLDGSWREIKSGKPKAVHDRL